MLHFFVYGLIIPIRGNSHGLDLLQILYVDLCSGLQYWAIGSDFEFTNLQHANSFTDLSQIFTAKFTTFSVDGVKSVVNLQQNPHATDVWTQPYSYHTSQLSQTSQGQTEYPSERCDPKYLGRPPFSGDCKIFAIPTCIEL